MTNRNPLEEKELHVVNGGEGDDFTTIHIGDYFESIASPFYIIATTGNETATSLICIDFDMYSKNDDSYIGKWNGNPNEMKGFFVKIPDKCNPNYVPHA